MGGFPESSSHFLPAAKLSMAQRKTCQSQKPRKSENFSSLTSEHRLSSHRVEKRAPASIGRDETIVVADTLERKALILFGPSLELAQGNRKPKERLTSDDRR